MGPTKGDSMQSSENVADSTRSSSFSLGQSTTIHFEAEQNNNQKTKHDACAYCPGYPSRWSRRCGACQLVCGFILTTLGIAAYCLYFDEFWNKGTPIDSPYDQRTHRKHVSIWGGVLTMVTGILGILSAILKRRYVIVLCLVMSVISALASAGVIAIAILSINCDKKVLVEGYLTASNNDFKSDLIRLEILKSRFAINATLLTVATLEVIAALIQVVICGRARRKSADLTGGRKLNQDIPKGLTTEGEPYFWIPLPAQPKQCLQVTFGPTINSGDASYYLTVSHPELNTIR